MRRISECGEVFEQRDDRDIVEVAAAQLTRVEWRHGHCRFDDVAQQGKLCISFYCIGVRRIIFCEKLRRRNIVIDEDLATAQLGQLRDRIVAHGMVDQQEIGLADHQILQAPDLSGQRRIYVFNEDVGLKSKVSQHRLNKKHGIGDRIRNRRTGMKLMYLDLILASHCRYAEPGLPARRRGYAAASSWTLGGGLRSIDPMGLVQTLPSRSKPHL